MRTLVSRAQLSPSPNLLQFYKPAINLHLKQYLPHFDQIREQYVVRGWLHTIVAMTNNIQHRVSRRTLLF